MLACPLLLLVKYPESMRARKGVVGLDVPGVPVGTSPGVLLAKCGTKTHGDLVGRGRCILTRKMQMKPLQSVPSELGNQLASEEVGWDREVMGLRAELRQESLGGIHP